MPWGEEIRPKLIEYFEMEVNMADLHQFIMNLENPDRLKRHWAIIGLRKVLSIQKETPIQTVIDQNIVYNHLL